MPLCKIAKLAGFEVIVLDDRIKYANRERFPEADVVEAGPIPELAAKFSYGDNAYVVIVTRGHTSDEEAVRTFIQYDTAYLGLIGSVAKIDKISGRLERDGVSREQLERVHSPIGLGPGRNQSWGDRGLHRGRARRRAPSANRQAHDVHGAAGALRKSLNALPFATIPRPSREPRPRFVLRIFVFLSN